MNEEVLNAFDMTNVDDMSDEELQEAFASGILKPGLNIPFEERELKNNVSGLKFKLKEIKLNLNWIERLDLINTPAPMAPEVYDEATKENSNNVVSLKNRWKFNGAFQSRDCVNDFKREMFFHRQAQAAVLEGVPKLKSLGILTKRPDDYFAEMAKSDDHMHKVRQNLAARQTAAAESQKMKQFRKQRKLGKKAQVEAKLKQAEEKRKMLNEVKKFRKGVSKDLSFLDDKPSKKHDTRNMRAQKKKAFKDGKFGFGGRKKGSKRNTKESASYNGSLAKKGD
ncbi:hypothetical protein RUM43_009615 [Polyplax serrata]|uniref:Uncharacterized protein n=1 Tax=Polyplax serrata TaxID=468196 RepID=A0AAN8S8L0_POLSC